MRSRNPHQRECCSGRMRSARMETSATGRSVGKRGYGPAIVILFGSARRTARQIEEASPFYANKQVHASLVQDVIDHGEVTLRLHIPRFVGEANQPRNLPRYGSASVLAQVNYWPFVLHEVAKGAYLRSVGVRLLHVSAQPGHELRYQRAVGGRIPHGRPARLRIPVRDHSCAVPDLCAQSSVRVTPSVFGTKRP